MQKQLKNKLNKMDKNQLIEVIDSLCDSKETEKLLKIMLMPSQKEVDKAIQKLSRCADVYVSNSCSDKYYNKLMEAMNSIYAALKYADNKLSAYIIYEVYQVAEENNLFELECEVSDLLGDLYAILEQNPDEFTEEERKKYSDIIDE